jgi:gamma-butyrobetaine dioxygenase
MRASVEAGGRRIRVTFADGASREFAGRWLFDHADEARDAVSGQRDHGAMALDCGAAVETAQADGDALRLRFLGSGVERTIPVTRLRVVSLRRLAAEPWATPERIAQAPPMPLDAYLTDDGALREVLSRVRRWGLAVLSGAGTDPSAVERAVAKFGFVRETNYGRTFDVRIEPKPGNLAYTDRGLDLHTDNPYRDPVPTLQLLHAIVVDEGGGASLFADGFAHAEALRHEAPDAFEILAQTPARFTFADASGARWSHAAPVLSLDVFGAIEAIRLNHRSLDIEPTDAAAMDAWYDAYLAFSRRVHAPRAIFERRLAPGDMVVFDNRRILHG